MDTLFKIIYRISRALNVISTGMLAFMILLTVADVILRSARRPILGTYEIVGLLCAIVIGFSIPYSTWMKGHVRVDFFLIYLPSTAKKVLNILTRCLGVGLFIVIGWNLIVLGKDLFIAGEVTPTRHIPYYPVVYGIGVCCFFQSIVIFCDIIKVLREKYE
jgi:TRAP-type C4-dicarboxylate transport system permease small subunit